MNLARVSANGQVTVPMEIRNFLNIKEGDKISFTDRNGEIIINNASANAILNAQKAFSGVAEKLNNPDEATVQSWVDEIRYGKDTACTRGAGER